MLPSPKIIGRVPFRAEALGDLALTSDGERVVLVHSRGVQLFDAQGACVAFLRSEGLRCGCLLDDRTLLLGRYDGTLWRLALAELEAAGHRALEEPPALGALTGLAGTALGRMVLSPAGDLLAVGCAAPLGKTQKHDKALRLLDARTLELRALCKGMRRLATDLAFSHDGALLAAAGDAVVRVYDARTGKVLRELGSEEDTGVAFLPDGRLLTLGRETGLRAWAPTERDARAPRKGETPEREARLQGWFLSAPRVDARGDVVVLERTDKGFGWARRFAGEDLAEKHARELETMPVAPLAPLPRGEDLWIQQGYAVRPLRGPTMEPAPPGGHVESVCASAVHPEGRWALSADTSLQALAWDLEQGRCVHCFERERELEAVRAVGQSLLLALAEQRPVLLVHSPLPSLRSWDPERGARVWPVPREALDGALRLFASPRGDEALLVLGSARGSTLALVGEDGGVRWKVPSVLDPEELRWEGPLLHLLSPRGAWRVHLADGREHSVHRGSSKLEALYAPRFAASPSGALAATAGMLGDLFVWETETGRSTHEVRPHTLGIGKLTGLAWSADGESLLVLDEDRYLEARDPATLALRSRETLCSAARWKAFSTRGGRLLVVPTHAGHWELYDTP